MTITQIFVFSLVIYVIGIFIAILAATTITEEEPIICIFIGLMWPIVFLALLARAIFWIVRKIGGKNGR